MYNKAIGLQSHTDVDKEDKYVLEVRESVPFVLSARSIKSCVKASFDYTYMIIYAPAYFHVLPLHGPEFLLYFIKVMRLISLIIRTPQIPSIK